MQLLQTLNCSTSHNAAYYMYLVIKQLFCLFVCLFVCYLLFDDFSSCCLAGILHNGGSHNDHERKIH